MADIKFVTAPTIELVEVNASDQHCIQAMLVSTLSDVEADNSWTATRNRIRFLMENRHGSPFEHNSFTFRVTAPIAVFREWHRHRIGWSYNEQSGRYTEFAPVFYMPPRERPLVQVGKPGQYSFVPGTDKQYAILTSTVMRAVDEAWTAYEDMLAAGIAKEVARGVLPVYTMSTMYATCNARSLMAFLSLRTQNDNATFPSFPMYEIRECADRMEELWAEYMPITAAAFHDCGRVAP